MTATTPIAVATAFLAMALAGCTGGFQVDQTEPFRIQLEGEPETVTVRDTDTEAQRVEVATDCETTCAHEEVDVELTVEKVSSEACTILVTIQGDDGQTIATRTITVSGSGDGASTTTTSASAGNETGNATTNSTTTMTTGSTGGSAVQNNVVVQNIVVNVKGNKNIVVLTQAQDGAADIDITAVKASGHSAGIDNGDGSTSAGTTTAATTTTTGNATMTTSSSGNATTGP